MSLATSAPNPDLVKGMRRGTRFRWITSHFCSMSYVNGITYIAIARGTTLALRVNMQATRRGFSVLIGTAVIATSCGKKPDPADTLSSVSSEMATASLAGRVWLKHRTPNSFTGNTLSESRMNIAEQQNILFTEAVPPVDTAQLRSSLDHAKDMLATMEKLIARQDVKSFPAALAFFEEDAKKVQDMSDSLEKKQ